MSLCFLLSFLSIDDKTFLLITKTQIWASPMIPKMLLIIFNLFSSLYTFIYKYHQTLNSRLGSFKNESSKVSVFK